jgi:hypothetical protein
LAIWIRKSFRGWDFHGETFRVLKAKEEKHYGEYRTTTTLFPSKNKGFELKYMRAGDKQI